LKISPPPGEKKYQPTSFGRQREKGGNVKKIKKGERK
jgi:hypothetical protein